MYPHKLQINAEVCSCLHIYKEIIASANFPVMILGLRISARTNMWEIKMSFSFVCVCV